MASAKPTPKKKTAPKKQTIEEALAPPVKPLKKRRRKKQVQPQKWQEMNIAQRTAFRKRNKGTIFACLAMLFLFLAAGFFKFCLAGYGFTALVCAGLGAVIGFYTFFPKLFRKFPVFSKVVVNIFTIILCIGILIFGITEALIIRASFGTPQADSPYILVLGAKVRKDGPSLSLQNRIDKACEYLTDHPQTIAIVSGGRGEDEPMTEAQCMYDGLVAQGIDPSRIWMEDKASSTWENLHFSLNLIEEKTGQRPTEIAVLSSEYHLFRASLFAKAAGAEFIGIPARTTYPILMVNYFMREVAGVWHYILLGGNYT